MTAESSESAERAVTLAYVRGAAAFLNLPLSDERAGRVAEHLTRTHALAALLQAVPMAADAEPAEIFRPAPFPVSDPADDPGTPPAA